MNEKAISVSTTRDVDEHAVLLADWVGHYQQISAGEFEGTMWQARIGGIQLFRELTTQRVHQTGQAWSNSFTVAMPLALSEPIRWRGANVGVDGTVCYHGADELELFTSRHCDLLAVAVDTDDFAAYAATVEGRDVRPWLNSEPLPALPAERQAQFKSFLYTVLHGAISDPAPLLQAQAQKELKETVYSHLIDLQTAPTETPERKSYGQRNALVARAREQLYSNPDTPVTVADLCCLLGVSRRSLQYAFEDVLGINPLAYLRALRLNGVRREIKSRGPAAAVLDIAARWGFWHPSHFSADYRRMFGEVPSTTRSRYAHAATGR